MVSDLTIPAGQWRGHDLPDGDLAIQPVAVNPGDRDGWLAVAGYTLPPGSVARELVLVQVRAEALPADMGPGWRRPGIRQRWV